jgi:hypothetical protein
MFGVSRASNTAVSTGPITAKKVVKAVRKVSAIVLSREAAALLAFFATKHDAGPSASSPLPKTRASDYEA